MTREGDRSAEGARAAGLLLAAGAGRRMGRPKALLADGSGRALSAAAVSALRAAGCCRVLVVLGAEARQAGALLPTDPTTTVVTAEDWDQGLGASLRAGLTAVMAAAEDVEAVLVTLVDLPDVAEPVMRRVLERWSAGGARPDALLRATYDGRPGHPVLLGRSHWSPLLGTLTGDVGAGPYLTRHLAEPVPCEDLATGRDLDLPEDLGDTLRAVR